MSVLTEKSYLECGMWGTQFRGLGVARIAAKLVFEFKVLVKRKVPTRLECVPFQKRNISKGCVAFLLIGSLNKIKQHHFTSSHT